MHAYPSLLGAALSKMSSESALPVAIPNVAQGVDVSACSLWPTKEKKALACQLHLLEAVGFDLQLLFSSPPSPFHSPPPQRMEHPQSLQLGPVSLLV